MQQLMDIDRHGEFAVRMDRIEAALNRIAEALEQSYKGESPNYRRRLSEYNDFNWDSIGATPVSADARGFVNEVEWNQHRWIRRRSKEDDDFGEAIWFSRQIKDKEYATLIKFADYKVKRLGEDVSGALVSNGAGPQQPPPRATVGQSGAAPTTQPHKFLYEMRHRLQVDDREIKRRLKAAGVTGFPAATNEAAYAQLTALLTTGEVV